MITSAGLPDPNSCALRGHSGPLWSEWFAGLSVTNLENGEAILWGPLPDQAALHGVLMRLRDLGLPLLGIERSTPNAAAPPSG
jgi:hypothetical protein